MFKVLPGDTRHGRLKRLPYPGYSLLVMALMPVKINTDDDMRKALHHGPYLLNELHGARQEENMILGENRGSEG